MTQTTHPVYNHDCESCLFLGAKEVKGKVYDFYFCPKTKSNIARFGSDAPDYLSLPAFLVRTFGHIEPYKTGLNLASNFSK